MVLKKRVVIGFDTHFRVGYVHNANISTSKMFLFFFNVFLFNRKSFNVTNERV